jgi:hypothetical protein
MRPLPKARLENIIDHIRDEPKSVRQIVAELSLPYTSVYRYMFALHMRKMVHIDGWVDSGTRYAATFLAGPGEDTPHPTRKAVRTREAKKHVRIVPKETKPRVQRERSEPVTVQRDPLVAAVFGEPNQAKAASIKPFRDPLTAALFGDAQ